MRNFFNSTHNSLPLEFDDWVKKTDERSTFTFEIPADWKSEFLERRQISLSEVCDLTPSVQLIPSEELASSSIAIFINPQRREKLYPQYKYEFKAIHRVRGAVIWSGTAVVDNSDFNFVRPPSHYTHLFRPVDDFGLMIEVMWGESEPNAEVLNGLERIIASASLLPNAKETNGDFYGDKTTENERECLAKRKQQ